MSNINKTIKSPSVPAFVGIDLAKHSVHVWGVDEAGAVCLDRERGEAVAAGVAPDALVGGGPAHGARE